MIIITALVFLAVLSVLVLIHELGHFLAAKKLGMKVEEFGFGLPPRIFGIKRGETTYSINWLPIGGFVKLHGEDGGAHSGTKQDPDYSRAFYARPPWQRSIVLLAGVTMNFILAIVLTSYLFTQGVMVPVERVHIEKSIAGSPAATAGIAPGDIIKAFQFNDQTVSIKNGDQIIKLTREHLGEEITLKIIRGAQEKDMLVTPRKDFPKDQGPLGIVISNYEEKKYPWYQAPVLGTKEALKLSWELVKGIGVTVWKLISFQSVSKDVAGPLGIAQMTGQAIKFGSNAVLELMALLSLNLAIVNVLPFPALDGGRLLFVIIEWITGKKVRTNWERYVHQIGMAILLTLIVLITLNDIYRLVTK